MNEIRWGKRRKRVPYLFISLIIALYDDGCIPLGIILALRFDSRFVLPEGLLNNFGCLIQLTLLTICKNSFRVGPSKTI